MEPFVQDADFTLYQGDALDVLRGLPDESVHCVLTSPPFYGLRDYGMDGQIGLEASPEEWAARLVEVFAECRRVLRSDGSLWIECGDSYVSGQGGRQSMAGELPPSTRSDRVEPGERPDLPDPPGSWSTRNVSPRFYPGRETRLKPKDLLGQPFLLAFALRADGWYWRGCYPWAKPNAMPESAKDRCTVSHSYILHFAKSPRYFFDGDAISEPAAWERWGDQTVTKVQPPEAAASWIKPKTRKQLEADHLPSSARAGSQSRWRTDGRQTNGQRQRTEDMRGFDNRLERADGFKHPRSVWTIPTQGYPDAHFATWPEALAERIIKAATSEHGCCPECGKPWEREVEPGERQPEPEHRGGVRLAPGQAGNVGTGAGIGARFSKLSGQEQARWKAEHPATMLGWRPGCMCQLGPQAPGTPDPIPATVLDPFAGSGTTNYVARKLGRRSVGIELNESYCALAARRLQQQSLFAEATS